MNKEQPKEITGKVPDLVGTHISRDPQDSSLAFDMALLRMKERLQELSTSRTLDDRAYPPLSLAADTVIFSRNGEMRALHQTNAQFITDKSILNINLSKRDWEFSSDLEIKELTIGGQESGAFVLKTEDGLIPVAVQIDSMGRVHHLIPQQAHRSCVYAGASMILLDACSKHGISELSSNRVIRNVIAGNLGNEGTELLLLNQALEDTHLEPQVTELEEINFESLNTMLEENGAATAGIVGEIGGHEIVLVKARKIDENIIVTVRDPFHGWDIDVDLGSLTKRGLGKRFIQIVPTV